ALVPGANEGGTLACAVAETPPTPSAAKTPSERITAGHRANGDRSFERVRFVTSRSYPLEDAAPTTVGYARAGHRSPPGRDLRDPVRVAPARSHRSSAEMS